MNPMNRWLRANSRWFVIALVAGSWACSSGAAANKKPQSEGAANKTSSGSETNGDVEWGHIKKQEPPSGAPSQCLDSEGQQVECSSNEDCCDGFECGIDPDGSARIKTCIWAGKEKK